MARTWIPVRDLKAGNLPPVCAKTGAAAKTFYPTECSSAPPWAVRVLLFGVPLRTTTAFGTRRVTGLVPLREDVHAHLRLLDVGRWGTALLALGLMLLAVATTLMGVPLRISQALACAGVSVLGCAGVLAAFGMLRSVNAQIDPDQTWVRLSGVHPKFAAAVEADYTEADYAKPVWSAVG